MPLDLAILVPVRGADGPAPTARLFEIDACQITCKALSVKLRSRRRESLASRLGDRVKTELTSFT